MSTASNKQQNIFDTATVFMWPVARLQKGQKKKKKTIIIILVIINEK